MSTRGGTLPGRPAGGRERLPPVTTAPSAASPRVERGAGADDAIRNVFGHALSDHDLAGLVGAQPGDRVLLTGKIRNQQVGLQVLGQKYSHVGDHFVYHDEKGHLILFTNLVSVAADQRGTGLTTRMLRDQVRTASRLGMARIDLVAGRGEFTADTFKGVPGISHAQAQRLAGTESGYVFWPQRGFSTHLRGEEDTMPVALRAQLPPVDAQISDLVRASGGVAWLREHGEQRGMSFDLTRGSVSRQILAGVLRGHRARAR